MHDKVLAIEDRPECSSHEADGIDSAIKVRQNLAYLAIKAPVRKELYSPGLLRKLQKPMSLCLAQLLLFLTVCF